MAIKERQMSASSADGIGFFAGSMLIIDGVFQALEALSAIVHDQPLVVAPRYIYTFDVTFKVLSFDCYGTLIDWEAGICAVLVPWAAERGLQRTDEDMLLAYADDETAVEREIPTVLGQVSRPGSVRSVRLRSTRPGVLREHTSRKLVPGVPGGSHGRKPSYSMFHRTSCAVGEIMNVGSPGRGGGCG
jgi:hypothetical protein